MVIDELLPGSGCVLGDSLAGLLLADRASGGCRRCSTP